MTSKQVVILLCLSACLHALEIDENSGLLNFTVQVIMDWNLKHVDDHQNNVAVISLDRDKTFENQLINNIASNNPILITSSLNCKNTELHQKSERSAFVIVIVGSQISDVSNFY